MIHTPAIRVLTRTCAAAALVLYLVLGAAPKAAAAEPVRGNETSAERIRSAIAAIFSAAEAAIAAQSLPVHENVDDVIDLDPEIGRASCRERV